jgi:hypothetical protein
MANVTTYHAPASEGQAAWCAADLEDDWLLYAGTAASDAFTFPITRAADGTAVAVPRRIVVHFSRTVAVLTLAGPAAITASCHVSPPSEALPDLLGEPA